MGNEMGNNNVSGVQEQEKADVEATKKSSEASRASINAAGNIKAENQQVSSTKEEGFHEKHTGLSSEKLSGVNEPPIEKDSSDGREQESSEVEATNRFSEAASLASISPGDIKSENQPISSTKEEDFHDRHTGLSSEEPSGVMEPHIKKDSSDVEESDETEVQVSDGLSNSPLLSNVSKDHETQSISSSVDRSFHEMDSALEKNSSGTNDHQIQKQTSIGREGEELKSSSLDTESMESEHIPSEPSAEDVSEPEGSNEDVLRSNGSQEENIISSSESKVATNMDTTPKEEMGFQLEDEVVDTSNMDEKITETSNGVEVGYTPTLIDAHEKEAGVEAPISNAILIIPTENLKVIEKGTEEQDYNHKTVTLTDQGSLEESKLTTMNSFGFEFMGMDSGHEEKKKGSDRESQTDDANVNQVDFHDRKMSEENGIDLEKESEPAAEFSTSSTEFRIMNTNGEEEIRKEGDLDSPDSVLSPSYQTEPKENLVPTSPVSLDQFQDGKHKLTLLESEMQDNLRSFILESNQGSHNMIEDSPDSEFLTIETSMQHETFDTSATEHSQLNHESSNTGSDQVVLKNPIAEAEDSSKESRKEDTEHNPLLNQKVSAESNAEHHKTNTEVSSYELLPPEVQTRDSDPTTFLYQEKTTKTDNFTVENPVAETEFAVLEPLNFYETTEEKQVISVETTDAEKLKTPLLNKQERHVVKKTVEEQLNSVIDPTPPEKEKRKPKYSLFSNCICCTAVIQ